MSTGDVFYDERGAFILRWTRRTKTGAVVRAKLKPFKIYISREI